MKAKTLILTVAAVIALSTAYMAVDVMANRGDGALGAVYVSTFNQQTTYIYCH